MKAIILKNAVKRFGRVTAVDNVSLEIEQGELFFLLGPSGCGKTTLLRIIAGFCSLDDGDVLINDSSVKSVPPRRRNTAMVFQNYALWPHMPVFRNVSYGLEERGVPRQQRRDIVMEALRKVRMEDYAERMPNELSGGQQQRVAVARALVVKPDVILFDEPLSNLDAKLRLEMRHEIRRIHESIGTTMVYVTHDQKEALTMADRIAVMSMGRIEQTGRPRELYLSPDNAFVASFMGEANLVPGRLSDVSGNIATVNTPIGSLKARAGNASRKDSAEVYCMIRPEHMRINGPGPNRIESTVVSSTFSGETEQYTCKANGLELRVISLPMPQPFAKGANVTVSFAQDDALVLPAARTEDRP